MQLVAKALTPVHLATLITLVVVAAPGCGADCDKLGKDLNAAVAAFTPTSSNACSTADDCTLVDDWVKRDGRTCWAGCGAVFSSAAAAEFTAFLDNDPRVTAACKAYLHGNCTGKHPPGPGPACPATIPACSGGQCTFALPGLGG